MVIRRLETAAAAALPADEPGSLRQVARDLAVERAQLYSGFLRQDAANDLPRRLAVLDRPDLIGPIARPAADAGTHAAPSSSQLSRDSVRRGQNGNVRHWRGLTAWMEQRRSSVRKMQSPFGLSTRPSRCAISRV